MDMDGGFANAFAKEMNECGLTFSQDLGDMSNDDSVEDIARAERLL